MPSYIALIYSAEMDWSDPANEAARDAMMAEYGAFGHAAAAVLRGGSQLYPAASATTVRVPAGKGSEPMLTDGPFADTKEALTGYYLMECVDLDEAVAWAAQIPAAWNGAVEVRPLVP